VAVVIGVGVDVAVVVDVGVEVIGAKGNIVEMLVGLAGGNAIVD
jgi:hypothetical protein